MSDAASKILSLYDAGVPFFTKEAIRNVYQQLKKSPEKGQKVSVRGLDGVMVDFEIQTGGTVGMPASEEWEYLIQTPFIYYVPIQRLISNANEFDDQFAYCSLRIVHSLAKRNKFTKEPLYIPSVKSCEEVEKFLKTSLQAWEASEPCQQLRSTLISAKISFEINKIIGFACGTMWNGYQDQWAYRSSFQHALILTMRDVLGEKENPNGVVCYAQDPAYTDSDKFALEASGITVLDDPEAFLEVDDSSVVFSCSPNVAVKQTISDLARPPIIIWCRVEEDKNENGEEEVITTDPDSPRVREMIHNFYDELEFPNDEEHFGDVAIYVRRTATSSTN